MSDPAELDTYLARITLGDRESFLALYRASSAKLYGVVLRVLNDAGDAEEVLQEVFVKIWYGAEGYRPGAMRPMGWLVTVARNTAIDRLRHRPVRAEGARPAERLADTVPAPKASVDSSQGRVRLAACLRELQEEWAEAVQRAYMMGDTYAQLADRFGLPSNTMRTWLRRNLKTLSVCLTR